MARVLPYPWSLLAPRGSLGTSSSMEDCEGADPFNPETLTLLTRIEDEPAPGFPDRRISATPLSTNVMWNPQTEVGRRLAILSVPSFPREPSGRWHMQVGRNECIIPVQGAMRHVGAWEELTKHNADEVYLRDTVDMLSGYFREAVALTHDKVLTDSAEFAGQHVARLDWKTIWERWKKVSTGAEPRMARVVDIAFSHLAGIRDVCERPRRMLVRQREQLSLGRVQELDAVCLRDLIRRPGRTVLEKAGARQEILAVTRRETVDTAENRIIRDFVRLCQHRARAYERENARVMGHRKVRAVVDLRHSCERFDACSPISAAGQLVGVARPNYVLQKDRRYHPLWVQYDRLRREEDAVDNIWPWSRILWAEFVRGVVLSFLRSDEAHTLCGWRPDDRLAAYLRTEHISGRFMPALSASSRLVHRDGQSQMFVVHPAHAHLCPGLNDLLPRLGADFALAVYPSGNEHFCPRALLCIYSVLSLQTNAEQRHAMVTSLQTTLENVSLQNPGLNVRALLLRGEWPGDRPSHSVQRGRLDYLVAPAGAPFWFEEFPEMLAVLLEEIAG